jgi:hypothetical protein
MLPVIALKEPNCPHVRELGRFMGVLRQSILVPSVMRTGRPIG